jgi:hypothetical protein
MSSVDLGKLSINKEGTKILAKTNFIDGSNLGGLIK